MIMKKRLLAFTFVELMIAITIFAVVAIVIYSSFSASIKVWKRGEESVSINQNLRIGLDDFGKELRNALNYNNDNDPAICFEGQSNSLSFPIYLTSETGGQFGIVLYKKDGASLKREENIFGQASPQEESLIDGVEEAKFLYAFDTQDTENPYEWNDSWQEKNKIPRGVKLTLKLQKGGSFTKTVFIPTGGLGKKP